MSVIEKYLKYFYSGLLRHTICILASMYLRPAMPISDFMNNYIFGGSLTHDPPDSDMFE